MKRSWRLKTPSSWVGWDLAVKPASFTVSFQCGQKTMGCHYEGKRGLLKDLQLFSMMFPRVEMFFHPLAKSFGSQRSTEGNTGFHQPIIWNLELPRLPGKPHFCPWQAAATHLHSLARTRRNFPFNLYLLRLSGVPLFPNKPAPPSVSPVLPSGNRKATSQEKACNTLKTSYKRIWFKSLMHWSNLNTLGWPEVDHFWEKKW